MIFPMRLSGDFIFCITFVGNLRCFWVHYGFTKAHQSITLHKVTYNYTNQFVQRFYHCWVGTQVGRLPEDGSSSVPGNLTGIGWILWMSPTIGKALPMVKHESKFILNQTYVDHEAYQWEGSYAYSSIRGGFCTTIRRNSFPPTLEE